MGSQAQRLQILAEREVQETLSALPGQLREPAEELPVVYDTRIYEELLADEAGDLLGLFVGENFVEQGHGSGGLPAQIILYLDNIWWEAQEDETVFRKEVRATYLHELGHYLGLEEVDLHERGL
jgi:predicted Zn-dependent protease with MMP-like domain